MPPSRTTRASEKRPTRSSTRKRAASPPPAPLAKRPTLAKPKASPKPKPAANHEEALKSTRRPRRPPPRRVDRAAVPSSRSFAARQRDLPSVNPFPAPPLRERPCWQLFGWGSDNKDGPMGTGDEFPSEKPRRSKVVEKLIEGGEFGLNGAGLVAIAAGGFFSLMVDEIGQVWSFGNNEVGQLGRTTVKNKDGVEVDAETSVPLHTPVRIRCFTDEFFRTVKVEAGSCIAAALSDRGELRVWGAYYYPQNSGGDKFMFSPHLDHQPSPILIPELAGERFADVVAGANHLVLLTIQGDVYTMGQGADGQLGHKVPKGTPTAGTVPYKVLRGTTGHRAVAIGAANDSSFFVDQQGEVWAWGLNGYGQTGTGSKQNMLWYPHRVRRVGRTALGGEQDGAAVVQIAGGDRHTLFLASDGRVFACGNAEDGQFPLPKDGSDAKTKAKTKATTKAKTETKDGEVDVSRVSEPVPVEFPHDLKKDPIVQIGASNRMSAAVTRDGVLYTWGLNSGGMLGTEVDSPDDIVRTPTVVVRRDGSWLTKAVSCGGQHCLALLRRKP